MVKYCRKTVGMIKRTKPITAVTVDMGTVHAVVPWEQESRIFSKGVSTLITNCLALVQMQLLND